jgi:hypothetical protein
MLKVAAIGVMQQLMWLQRYHGAECIQCGLVLAQSSFMSCKSPDRSGLVEQQPHTAHSIDAIYAVALRTLSQARSRHWFHPLTEPLLYFHCHCSADMSKPAASSEPDPRLERQLQQQRTRQHLRGELHCQCYGAGQGAVQQRQLGDIAGHNLHM